MGMNSGTGVYRIDFACDDRDPLQAELNRLYGYTNDLDTKIAHRNRLNRFVELLTLLKEAGILTRGKALDVGCGPGIYSGILGDMGFVEVLGIDSNPKAIVEARLRFGRESPHGWVRFQAASVDSLDSSIRNDFILCTEVIEHTQDPAKTVRLILDALSPGGIAVVSMPNRLSAPYFLLEMYRRLRHKPIEEELAAHLRFPFYKTLRMLRRDDIEVLRVAGVNLFLMGPFLRRVYRTGAFATVNRINFAVSRRRPLCYFGQFLFVVLRKTHPNA